MLFYRTAKQSLRALFQTLEYLILLALTLGYNTIVAIARFVHSLRTNQLNQFIVILSITTIAIWTINYLPVPESSQASVNFPPKLTEEQIHETSLMEAAITYAALQYDVPRGLLVGIAHAESSYGRNFHIKSDVTCSNWWGIKGGPARTDGSYIRCFTDPIAGATTVAKALRLYYLDEGRISAAQICQKWIGSIHADKHCPNWIATVTRHYN